MKFYKSIRTNDVIAYSIGEQKSLQSIVGITESTTPFAGGANYDDDFSTRLNNYTVPSWGKNNLYPNEVDRAITDNKLLPSVLQKRVEFLYGKGLCLKDAEGNITHDPAVSEWLAAWEQFGYDSVEEYIRTLIYDYYRFQTCCTQYHTAKSKRVVALSAIPAKYARLAAVKWQRVLAPRNNDCTKVIVGDWRTPTTNEMEIYNRFDAARPFVAGAIQFLTDSTRPGTTYAYNTWYDGLREWIKASNLTPKYLSSYLENALNAHVHVQIPAAWYDAQKQILQNLCQQNLSAPAGERVQKYRGLNLLNDAGEPYAFNETMVTDLIELELEKITNLLSGAGKNQGKLYATIKVGNEGWTFTDFPGKYKEYFDAVLGYDKRADQVTLAGVGISSSITNVESDGQISKSGSDVYYNYIIYLNSLAYAENMVLRELNRCLKLNFPTLYTAGVRFRMNIEIPKRTSDITPSERLENQIIS